MSALEIALSFMTGSVSAVGAWWWVARHSHPDLVTKTEFHALLHAYHEAVIRELAELRADLRSFRD